MSRLLPFLLSSVLLLGGLAFAAPLKLQHVPAGVNMIVHFDAEAFRGTDLGRFLLKQVLAMDEDGGIEKMATTLGFHPLEDFKAVTLFADGVKSGSGVMLLHGAFDEETLVQLARENDRFESFAHGPATVRSWVEDRKKIYAYIAPDGSIVAMSDDRKQILRAVDTLGGTGNDLGQDNAVGLPLPKGGEFLFAGGAGFEKMKGLKAQAAILKQARTAVVTVREKEGAIAGSMNVLAEDADTAELMLEVIDSLLAFAREGVKKDADARALLAPLKTSSEGARVRLHFQHESNELIPRLQKRIDAETARSPDEND